MASVATTRTVTTSKAVIVGMIYQERRKQCDIGPAIFSAPSLSSPSYPLFSPFPSLNSRASISSLDSPPFSLPSTRTLTPLPTLSLFPFLPSFSFPFSPLSPFPAPSP